jgi:hypothetical protein
MKSIWVLTSVKECNLSKTELVSLFNAFHRFSESIDFLKRFKKLELEMAKDKMGQSIMESLDPFGFKLGSYFWGGLIVVVLGAIRMVQKYFEMANKYNEKQKTQ